MHTNIYCLSQTCCSWPARFSISPAGRTALHRKKTPRLPIPIASRPSMGNPWTLAPALLKALFINLQASKPSWPTTLRISRKMSTSNFLVASISLSLHCLYRLLDVVKISQQLTSAGVGFEESWILAQRMPTRSGRRDRYSRCNSALGEGGCSTH